MKVFFFFYIKNIKNFFSLSKGKKGGLKKKMPTLPGGLKIRDVQGVQGRAHGSRPEKAVRDAGNGFDVNGAFRNSLLLWVHWCRHCR